MPQVNEFSWLNSYFIFLLYLAMIFLGLNFILQLSSAKNFKPKKYSYIFLLD